jgi:hypothetical protein
MNPRGAYLKKKKNIENVMARRDFLLAINKDPNKISKLDRNSISGQRIFCAFEDKNNRIAAISLNTLKSIANQIFENEKTQFETGFEYLESLRKSALLAISTSDTKKK